MQASQEVEFQEGLLSRLFSGILSRKKKIALGIYGPVNSGKTTLANRICTDFAGRKAGNVSRIPHETRSVNIVENVSLKLKNGSILMDVIDTPGIATRVSYRSFLRYGFKKEEAMERAAEAARGVVEAIRSMERVDLALLVLDSTKDPTSQVNWVIAGNLKARFIPYIVVSNKIDLPYARPKIVERVFPEDKVVQISALRGDNVVSLY
ncbi:MAG: Era-like GTP-binding protein, partial [Candidatus Korarchaeum sp.]|nr:Era-like GTP-binding protein [Candidatus Korarchaeum sp.]